MVSGLLTKRCNIYLDLGITMLMGRLVYVLSLVGGVYLLGMHAPFMSGAAFISTIVTGIPGIILQFISITILYLALQRGGLTFEK